jgi:hypothetical protein
VEGETSVPAATPAVAQSQSEAQQALATFWTKVTEEIRKIGTVSSQFHGFSLAGVDFVLPLYVQFIEQLFSSLAYDWLIPRGS